MTYIAPVAERVAGFSAADLTWVLVIVGVGLVIGKRDPIPYALETDWPVGAAGFEPLHSRIGICQDSQPRRRDSNLCIWESDPLHSLCSNPRSSE
jgi:hypothetical protein